MSFLNLFLQSICSVYFVFVNNNQFGGGKEIALYKKVVSWFQSFAAGDGK